MKNILDKFQELSFNKKVAASIGVLAGFIVIITLIGVGIRTITPMQEAKPEDIATSTPTPSQTGRTEDVNQDDAIGADLSQEAATIINQISPFIQEAAVQICSQNSTETTESKIARLSPYVTDVEKKISANVFGISGYSQTCRDIGDYFESYDAKTKTLTFTSTMIEDFIPLSQGDVPQEQQVTGSRYSSYTLEVKQQPDGSWKVDKINGR